MAPWDKIRSTPDPAGETGGETTETTEITEVDEVDETAETTGASGRQAVSTATVSTEIGGMRQALEDGISLSDAWADANSDDDGDVDGNDGGGDGGGDEGQDVSAPSSEATAANEQNGADAPAISVLEDRLAQRFEARFREVEARHQAELDKRDAQLDKVTAEASEARSEAAAAKSEAAEARETSDALKTKLAEQDTEQDQLRDQISDLQTGREQDRAEIAGLRTQHDQDQQEIGALRGEVQSLTDKVQRQPDASNSPEHAKLENPGEAHQPDALAAKLPKEQNEAKRVEGQADRPGVWSNAKIALYAAAGSGAITIGENPHDPGSYASAALGFLGVIVPVVREGWRRRKDGS